MIDSRSEKGQRHLARLAFAMSRLLHARAGLDYMPSGHEVTRLDGVMRRGNTVVALVEGKDRECTYEHLRTAYRNEVILSRDKFDAALAAYKLLGYPTIGVWLFACDTIATQWIVRANGEPYELLRQARTVTRANCNDDQKVERDNCYVSLARARFLPPDAPLPAAA